MDDSVEGIAAAYAQLWGVVKLPAVMRLSVILVSCRLAFLCAESAASLKLIEKGVPRVCLESPAEWPHRTPCWPCTHAL